MRFQIMHETPGRMRLRADVRSMSMEQADILDAWLRGQPGVEHVTVHERVCGVIVIYHGDRDKLIIRLSGFSFEKAKCTLEPQVHSSRLMNREFKEKLVFRVIRHYAKRLILPMPVRQIQNVIMTFPRILKAARSLASG